MSQKLTDKQYQLSRLDLPIGDALRQIEVFSNKSTTDFLKTKFPRVDELHNEINFDSKLGALFIKVSNLAGLKSEISDINKPLLNDLILRRFNALSMEEIYYAFKLERCGDYDERTSHYDMFGEEYVSAILGKYKKWKQRKITDLKLNKKKEEVKIIDFDYKELNKQSISRSIDNMKKELEEHGEFQGVYTYVYDYLKENGKIQLTDKEQKEIVSEAKKRMKKFKPKIELQSTLRKITGSNKNEISVKCKEIALERYLKISQ